MASEADPMFSPGPPPGVPHAKSATTTMGITDPRRRWSGLRARGPDVVVMLQALTCRRKVPETLRAASLDDPFWLAYFRRARRRGPGRATERQDPYLCGLHLLRCGAVLHRHAAMGRLA
jgi:hypothetical protein